MRLKFLLIFALVSQVFATPKFNCHGLDCTEPTTYQARIDSLVVVGDSLSHLFSINNPELQEAIADTNIKLFWKVFNNIRDSLIIFYAEHPEEPLDPLKQEVLINWSCREQFRCDDTYPIGSGFYISRGQFDIFNGDFQTVFRLISTTPINYYEIYAKRKEEIDSLVATQKPAVRRLLEHMLLSGAYYAQRDSLSKSERRKRVKKLDMLIDSIATDFNLGSYTRAMLPHQMPHKIFGVDLSFFMAMPTIENSFNKLRFYGFDALFSINASSGVYGAGFNVGFGKNEGEDIHYEDIYHKGGRRTSGATIYFSYGYRLFDSGNHRFLPTIKLCHYDGHSGDDSIPVEDDQRILYYYSLGARYEFSPAAPIDHLDLKDGVAHDAVFASYHIGFDVNMHYADVVAIKAFIGVELGFFN